MESGSAVLDRYGNNVAVRCAACGEAFVMSTFLNARRGRACPHCAGSMAVVKNARVEVVATPETAVPGARRRAVRTGAWPASAILGLPVAFLAGLLVGRRATYRRAG